MAQQRELSAFEVATLALDAMESSLHVVSPQQLTQLIQDKIQQNTNRNRSESIMMGLSPSPTSFG